MIATPKESESSSYHDHSARRQKDGKDASLHHMNTSKS